MTRREELERIEREAREPEPPPPLPEPAVLALQRTAGNQATARFLQRQPAATAAPNLHVDNRANDLAWERVYVWFDELAAEVRKTEAGGPIQSVAELVYMAGE